MYNHSSMIDRIKIKKKEMRLTNRELAERAGLPIGTLNKILSGDSKDPQISAIVKISQILNVSADYIIFGIENKNQVYTDAGIAMYNKLDTEDKAEIGVINNAQQPPQPTKSLTTLEQDLLRIFNTADGKTQMKIMNFMYKIEEQSSQKQ